MQSKVLRHDAPLHLILGIMAIITFYPLIFTVFTSFKDNGQFYSTFWGPAFPLHWSNYVDAWRKLDDSIFNTIFVGVVSAFGVTFLGSLAAYVFARHQFPGARFPFPRHSCAADDPWRSDPHPYLLVGKGYGAA